MLSVIDFVLQSITVAIADSNRFMKRNPLRDPAVALRFIVEFAQADLTVPETLMSMEKQLRAFLSRSMPAGFDQPAPVLIPYADVQYLQARALELLTMLAEPRTTTTRDKVPFRFAIAGDLLLSFYGVQESGVPLRLYVMGSPLDRMLYKTMRLFESIGAERLLVCPECRRLFLKVTQKRFCSTKCQSRVYMRAYRERDE